MTNMTFTSDSGRVNYCNGVGLYISKRIPYLTTFAISIGSYTNMAILRSLESNQLTDLTLLDTLTASMSNASKKHQSS